MGFKTGFVFSASDKLAEAVKLQTHDAPVSKSDALSLTLPQIAEDGAYVPVTLESSLPGIDALFIFAENNPNPLIARFSLSPSLEAFISLQIKLNESGEVLALARSNGQFYSSSRHVRVVIGGCSS